MTGRSCMLLRSLIKAEVNYALSCHEDDGYQVANRNEADIYFDLFVDSMNDQKDRDKNNTETRRCDVVRQWSNGETQLWLSDMTISKAVDFVNLSIDEWNNVFHSGQKFWKRKTDNRWESDLGNYVIIVER